MKLDYQVKKQIEENHSIEIENDNFTMTITIPENCKAKVYLPGEEDFKEVGSGSYSYSKNLIKK